MNTSIHFFLLLHRTCNAIRHLTLLQILRWTEPFRPQVALIGHFFFPQQMSRECPAFFKLALFYDFAV